MIYKSLVKCPFCEHSNTVEITVYKSYENLEKDGYLKKKPNEDE